MSIFSPGTPRQYDLGITILRVITGVTFVAHGAQKLFVFGLAGVTGSFAQMGLPLPGLIGPLAAFVEFFGGLALIVGLLTRLAALGIALDMLGAILIVKLPGGFFAPKGIEFELSLLAAAATLAVTGAGALSLDAAIDRRRALASTPTVGPRPTGA